MKICATCKFAELGVTGPSPSGPEDGVNCHNSKMAELQKAQDEFEEYGSVNLFKIEVVAPGDECIFWESSPDGLQKGG